jgi:hypothetical protein
VGHGSGSGFAGHSALNAARRRGLTAAWACNLKAIAHGLWANFTIEYDNLLRLATYLVECISPPCSRLNND